MKDPGITPFERRWLDAVQRCPNGSATTTDLARRLGTSRVAVVAAGRALERAGLAVSWRHGTDRWAPLMWAPRRELPA